MKKRQIIICSVTICILAIIMGAIQYNRKQEQNNLNKEKKYTEKMMQLEKENEELKKDRNNTQKINGETPNVKEKTIEELKELLEKADLKNNEYQNVVNEVMNTYYMYKSNTCGENSKNGEYIDGYTYVESYKFHNLNEVKSYLKKFLSGNYIDNYNIIEKYEEKDNKLYCRLPGKSVLVYEPEGTQFKIISSTENKIEVYCIEKVYQLDKLTQIQEHVTLVKENDKVVYTKGDRK